MIPVLMKAMKNSRRMGCFQWTTCRWIGTTPMASTLLVASVDECPFRDSYRGEKCLS
jgi:hypothetical protein